MALKHYGILRGKAVETKPGTAQNNHFQVHIKANGEDHRIAINVLSSDKKNKDLQFLVIDNFKHPITNRITGLAEGFTPVVSKPNGMALDYIRGNLFDINKMQILPPSQPGPDNDLNDKIGFVMSQAQARNADVYAFGEKWGPEPTIPDKVFSFLPGNGVHDIHMNQGNPRGNHDQDNGVWQDGGVLVHFSEPNHPENDRWVAYFLKFQSQAVHTTDAHPQDNQAGDTILTGTNDQLPEIVKGIRIVAALVNPDGDDVSFEKVLLFNPLKQAISLNGWGLLDSNKKKEPLTGNLAPGQTQLVTLTGNNAQLGNKGGIITLVDDAGLKIHGISYTRDEARSEGEWIVF
jgi:uncharacterized protein YukJ